jgi:hypothetical protein
MSRVLASISNLENDVSDASSSCTARCSPTAWGSDGVTDLDDPSTVETALAHSRAWPPVRETRDIGTV